ncbi:MAG TPA: cation diffusion facilitator family transporter [Anaerolineales bacterium]|nr:cation diffusion facilitator family transporter [Anaerolineales bacterium]HNA53790.1 cation diffusion facilitator family transporter [Anaerolineales bacterium]HNB85832.1 cation diffusion facilitator family transporter [Anaerolineales bacterium]HNH77773.1 cation diffusion facilitator family transporter [Anaerolineales bacterium]
MSHSHSHSHFGDLATQTTKRLSLSLSLTAAFVLVEVAAGIFGNSLALLTDAAHNFTDVIALGLSWYALKIALKPANAGKTFGYHRVGILVALVNSTTLILIALGIFYEAWQRFLSPPEVDSAILMGVGTLAFFINAVTAWLVQKGSEHDLNLRSAFLHLMGDVISTLGAVIAGVVIYFTKWNWLDPFVSVLIGAFIVWNAWGILRQTIHILLESTPENIDMPTMISDIRKVHGVRDVHDLHVWSISEGLRMLSAHVVTDEISLRDGTFIQNNINEMLAHEYHIQHATLQLECEGCQSSDLFCSIAEHHHAHH